MLAGALRSKAAIWTRPGAKLAQRDVDTFNAQYPQLSVGRATAFHDRFLVIDRMEGYLVSASLKDAGKRAFGIARIEDAQTIGDILSRLETGAGDKA